MRLLVSTTLLILSLSVLTGCSNGIFGKNGVSAINHAVGAVNQLDTTLGRSVVNATNIVNCTRDSLLFFLRYNSASVAHDFSMALLKGTIGFLDDPANRDALAHFLDSIITHTASPIRRQLILFRDSLFDQVFITHTQQLLRGIMQELVVRPTSNLLDLLTNDTRLGQLHKLLYMIIPSVLNDSSIAQIGKLRSALLGLQLKKDIAGWVDTALYVANRRLDSTLRPTIHSIVDENTSTIRKNAGWIIAGLSILAIIIGLVIYFVQHKKVMLNKRMLHYVTLQIENMKDTDKGKYDELTTKIQRTMQNHQLEGQLNKFLKEERIS